jgi:3-oxoacyl-[acyl-carrier-protein] synthase-3
MIGRDVFNFAATVIPPHVENLLDKTGLTKKDIDSFVFHQGSRFIIETLVKRLGLESSRVPLGLANVGNTVSSSIPLLLEQEIVREESKKILLCGFGVGLSWGSCILSRTRGDNVRSS